MKRIILKALHGQSDIRNFLCNASLIQFHKRNGDIRPIGVGEVIRRLVSKVALKLTINKAVAILATLQQCVGVKGAAENVVRYFRYLTQKLRVDDICLQVDLTNAFNSLHRDHMLRDVASSIP